MLAGKFIGGMPGCKWQDGCIHVPIEDVSAQYCQRMCATGAIVIAREDQGFPKGLRDVAAAGRVSEALWDEMIADMLATAADHTDNLICCWSFAALLSLGMCYICWSRKVQSLTAWRQKFVDKWNAGDRFNGALSFGYVKKTAGIDDESFTYLVELKVHVAMLELKDAPAAPGAVKMEEAR